MYLDLTIVQLQRFFSGDLDSLLYYFVQANVNPYVIYIRLDIAHNIVWIVEVAIL